MKLLDAKQACPCGRMDANRKPRTYGQCCGQWLEAPSDSKGPPDAESLMRSRYSAFVLEREAYLRSSWATAFRPERIEFEPGVKWLGLEVRSHQLTGVDTAEVEFVARQKPQQGGAVRLHERSRFVREDGRWLYLNGDAL